MDGNYLVSMLLSTVLVYSEIHPSWIHTAGMGRGA